MIGTRRGNRVQSIAGVLLAACSPISPPHEHSLAPIANAGASIESVDAGSLPPKAATPDAAPHGARVGDACEGDARACAADIQRIPLLCVAGLWTLQEPCDSSERCETSAGPAQGTCVPISPACSGRAPLVEFCDGELVGVCDTDYKETTRSCEGVRHCKLVRDVAMCVCAGGTIDLGQGCEMATDCLVAQGGCDAPTTCSVQAGQRVCSACPPGYRGDGSSGCAPLLGELSVDGGQLMPAFAPELQAYRVQLALLQPQLSLTARAPQGTRIEFNGSRVESGVPWQSPVMKLGRNTIRLVLTSESGVSNQHEIVVERSAVQEAYVKADHPSDNDAFGYGVALHDDTLVVGSMYRDVGAADSGAVHVFVRQGTRWTQQAYLTASNPAANDFFGTTVAVWGDSLAVASTRSSPFGNVVAPRSGVVDVYTRSGSSWTPQARLEPTSSAAPDLFGYGLSLQGDRLVVGAPYDSERAKQAGAVYVFERTGDTWGKPQKLFASKPEAEASLGVQVALDGDTFIAGAHHACQLPSCSPSPGPGSASVFVHGAAGWTEQALLRAPQPEGSDHFGFSVALQADRAIVGAPYGDLVLTTPPGKAYAFDRTNGQWTVTATFQAAVPRPTDFFGSSVGLAASAVVIGASSDAGGGRGVGADPSQSGASTSGAVYVFGRQADGWVRAAYLKASNADAHDALAERLAVWGDSIAVGASAESGNGSGVNPEDNNDRSKAGAVYVWR